MSTIILIYLIIGLVFCMAFAITGHRKIDPTAIDVTWTTKLLWLPAATLLWPLLATLWAKNSGKDIERGNS